MSLRFSIRSPLAFAAIAAVGLGATGAGAATVHRFAVTQGTGSEGATAFVQQTANQSALQGEVNASPNTGVKIPFGVLGEYDASGSTFGIGVVGISTTGYGVGAETFAGQPALIAINAGTSDGIQAYTDETSGHHYAVYGEDESGGAGIAGIGDSGDAIEATTMASGKAGVSAANSAAVATGYGVYAEDFSKNGGQGVHAGSHYGIAVWAHSESGTSDAPSIQAYSEVSGTDLIQGYAQNGYGDHETMRVTYPSADTTGLGNIGDQDASSDLLLNGDILITGHVYTECETADGGAAVHTCAVTNTSSARSKSGDVYDTYTAKQASPTLEDAGEAQLVHGFAHVALDPKFASVISTSSPYLVFMTPNGESKGLYVVNKSPSGFDVRENGNGVTTLPFDFRIVAKPFGETPRRLALASLRHNASAAHTSPRLEAQLAADRLRDASYQPVKHLPHPPSLVKR